MQQKVFAAYDGLESDAPLADLALDLANQQQASWPQLAAGHAGLGSIRTRDLQCGGFSVRLQYNPRRIVSSSAKVDQESIRERRCFLCVANLPAAQRGILYRQTFLVLCNPAPIFAQHFTVAHVDHVPQRIDGCEGALLALARDLGPRFTVFYNGPKAGASAPDHLHFQLSPAGMIPIEKDACNTSQRVLLRMIDGVSVFGIKNLGRGGIVLEGTDRGAVEQCVRQCIAAIKSVVAAAEEPMMNMLCSYVGSAWRIIVFPRRKHRPEVYFREGDEKILISPATVDVGGLVITPLEKDFMAVDAQLIRAIYREVCVTEETAEQVVARL